MLESQPGLPFLQRPPRPPLAAAAAARPPGPPLPRRLLLQSPPPPRSTRAASSRTAEACPWCRSWPACPPPPMSAAAWLDWAEGWALLPRSWPSTDTRYVSLAECGMSWRFFPLPFLRLFAARSGLGRPGAGHVLGALGGEDLEARRPNRAREGPDAPAPLRRPRSAWSLFVERRSRDAANVTTGGRGLWRCRRGGRGFVARTAEALNH